MARILPTMEASRECDVWKVGCVMTDGALQESDLDIAAYLDRAGIVRRLQRLCFDHDKHGFGEISWNLSRLSAESVIAKFG